MGGTEARMNAPSRTPLRASGHGPEASGCPYEETRAVEDGFVAPASS